MQTSFRKVLMDSHTAAIAVAVLLFSSLDTAFLAIWGLALPALHFLALAAVRISPFVYMNLDDAIRTVKPEEWENLPTQLSVLFQSLTCMLAAWILSRWVYGVGPLRALAIYRKQVWRKRDA